MTCLSCQQGYAIVEGRCEPCTDSLCAKCPKSPDECIECKSKYSLNQDNLCSAACVDNCISCNIHGECIQCKEGFFSAFCVPCDAQCATCDNPGQCTSCFSGSWLNPDTSQCEACPAECTTCDSPTSCLECAKGYELNNGTCKKTCPSNCVDCSREDQLCTVCASDYELSRDGNTCLPICPENCLDCSSPDTCNQCSLGYGEGSQSLANHVPIIA